MSVVLFLFVEILLFLESIVDIKFKKIPIAFLILLILYCLIVGGIEHQWILAEMILNVFPGIVFVLLALIYKNTIGLGDGLVICVIGLSCGWINTISILVTAFLLCFLYSGLLLIMRKGKLKTKIAFLPFLLLASIVPFSQIIRGN